MRAINEWNNLMLVDSFFGLIWGMKVCLHIIKNEYIGEVK
jgi:hypothetical protein